MKFGFIPKEWNDYFEDAYKQLKAAENFNFDSVWFEEHHENERYLPCPISALNSIFSYTNLKLGAIVILPLYHPYRLAEEISQLDCISKGRVIIAAVAGYREKDFKNFGIGLNKRSNLMDEGLRLLIELLSNEEVNFEGKYFSMKNARIIPRPYQKPRPPIWVGAWKESAVLRATKLADAWLPGQTAKLSEVAKIKIYYEEILKKLGRSVNVFPILRDVYVAKNKDLAYEESKESIIEMYQIDYSSSQHPLIGGERKSIEEWIEDRIIIGSPDDAIEFIDRIRKLGFNYLIFRTSLRKLRSEQIISSIKILGEKVIPYFINN
jgi:alkanesulfonate monooxygenase SsuD/methylene tetrahydromethanopterin reductase-like flavin-dependent oxidoreductase (luciferase family)